MEIREKFISRPAVHADAFYASTVAFILADLCGRFLENLWYSLLMSAFGIPFRYGIYKIQYITRSLEYWNESNILLTYGVGAAVILGLGFLMVSRESFSAHSNWIVRLFLIWLPFHLTGGILGQVVVSILQITGPGYALNWLFPGGMERLVAAMIAMGIWLVTTPFWASRFLMASPSESLIRDIRERKAYYLNTMVYAWLTGTLATFLIDLPDFDFTEILTNLVIGSVTVVAALQLPFMGQFRVKRIRYQYTKLRSSYYLVAILVAVAVLLKNLFLRVF